VTGGFVLRAQGSRQPVLQLEERARYLRHYICKVALSGFWALLRMDALIFEGTRELRGIRKEVWASA
jgi:hypothetical protein